MHYQGIYALINPQESPSFGTVFSWLHPVKPDNFFFDKNKEIVLFLEKLPNRDDPLATHLRKSPTNGETVGSAVRCGRRGKPRKRPPLLPAQNRWVSNTEKTSEYGTMIYAVRCRPFSEMPINGSSPGFFKASGVYADFIVPSYSGSFRL